MRSKASSFKWQYPLLSLRSSSSFLRVLPRLLVTSISPFIFPSITCFRKQFLRKMWPIQLSRYEHRNTKLTILHFRYRRHGRRFTYSLQILCWSLFSLIRMRIQVHIGKEIILILEAITVSHVVINSLLLCRIYKIPVPRGHVCIYPALNIKSRVCRSVSRSCGCREIALSVGQVGVAK